MSDAKVRVVGHVLPTGQCWTYRCPACGRSVITRTSQDAHNLARGHAKQCRPLAYINNLGRSDHA